MEQFPDTWKDKRMRSSQHRSVEGKSCSTNLITFYNEVSGLMDEGRAGDFICLDFTKTFDDVSHEICTEKVMKCGVK